MANKLNEWAREQYPLLSDIEDKKPMLKVVEDILEQQETGTWKHVGCRKVTSKTMEFYGVKSYVEDDLPIKHTYVYPDGSTKTRLLPKEFSVAKGFKSDKLFGMDKFPAGSAQAVTITEGELDAMSGFQMMGSKYPFVSLPSATPNKKLLENCKDWLGSFKKIYLSLDADDKAEKFAVSLMNLFPGRVYRVPHDVFKDANEFLMADAGEKFSKAWFSSGIFTPDNIYATEEDFLELLHDTPDHSYVPTGIDALDEKILGLMQGHVTVIKGPTGIGKSELMRYIEYNFIKNHPEVRFATWHLEETKLRSLLGVVSYYLNDNLTRKDLVQEKGRMKDVEDAIKYITHNTGYMQFHLREEDGVEELIEQIRVLTQVYGCKYVLVEPLQDVVSVGSDDSKEALLSDLAVRLSKLAADLNVGIVTIAHTNENNEIKYCRMIGQRASVVIDIQRDKEADNMLDRNTTSLTIKKNRPTGLEGSAGELLFDADSFTLREKGAGW
jgi:twinkle protein